jgi:hypothetical protein
MEDPPPVTEEITVKKERTPAQKQALLKAREKALQVRNENSQLRKKEKEIETHERRQKDDMRRRQIEEEYNKISEPEMQKTSPKPSPKKDDENDDEPEIQYVKRPKKKIIRVVESSSDDEVEFRLPKRKEPIVEKTEEELINAHKLQKYEQSRRKLFGLDL